MVHDKAVNQLGVFCHPQGLIKKPRPQQRVPLHQSRLYEWMTGMTEKARIGRRVKLGFPKPQSRIHHSQVIEPLSGLVLGTAKAHRRPGFLDTNNLSGQLLRVPFVIGIEKSNPIPGRHLNPMISGGTDSLVLRFEVPDWISQTADMFLGVIR